MPPDTPTAGGHSLTRPASPATGDFWVYGLRVRSDVPLPDWPALEPGEPDVVIRRGHIAGLELEGPAYSARTDIAAGQFRLAVKGVGRYSANDGSTIVVDADPDAKPEDIRLYLTGAMMGTILHQRGAYTLHASCVALEGAGGVAFAGRSGAGKSTLVATMVQRGATFVSDDICVLVPPLSGRLRVWPGAARVKLDSSALAGSASHLEAAGGNRGKYHLPIGGRVHPTSPLPLDRVYLLTDGEGTPRLERLSGLDAISALVDETYFVSFAHALGLASQVFRLAATVAERLLVSRLIRPRGLEHLANLASLIEQDARHPGP